MPALTHAGTRKFAEACPTTALGMSLKYAYAESRTIAAREDISCCCHDAADDA